MFPIASIKSIVIFFIAFSYMQLKTLVILVEFLVISAEVFILSTSKTVRCRLKCCLEKYTFRFFDICIYRQLNKKSIYGDRFHEKKDAPKNIFFRIIMINLIEFSDGKWEIYFNTPARISLI